MANFSDMSIDQLRDTIEQEAQKPAPDRDTVMGCLQELKRRDTGETPDEVLEAWEVSQQTKAKPASKGWGRAIAAAAIVALVLLVTIPDVCGEENVIQLIGRWTDSIFSFGEIQEHEFVYQTDHPGLQELYDTVTALGAERNVVPTWLPDGYELEQIKVKTKTGNSTVYASFVDEKHQIIINIIVFDSIKNTEYQKDISDVEAFEKDGVTHYIMENDSTWTAAWVIDNMECFLSADTEDNLRQMVCSIYESEEIS